MLGLALARRGYRLTNQTFRAATGVTDSRDAGRYLRELVDQGLLRMDGSRGAAIYRAVERVSAATTSADPILDALRAGVDTRRGIQEMTGLPRNHVVHRLRQLRAEGVVEMIGSPRSKAVRWHLREP
jgi:ATP-dependent DNA helicase RecG